jgi:hypothetical protein
MRRLEAGQSESWPGVAQGVKPGRRGVLRARFAPVASGRHRGPVRAYYEALPLVSWLDAGRVKAAKSARSAGIQFPAPVPGSTDPIA